MKEDITIRIKNKVGVEVERHGEADTNVLNGLNLLLQFRKMQEYQLIRGHRNWLNSGLINLSIGRLLRGIELEASVISSRSIIDSLNQATDYYKDSYINFFRIANSMKKQERQEEAAKFYQLSAKVLMEYLEKKTIEQEYDYAAKAARENLDIVSLANDKRIYGSFSRFFEQIAKKKIENAVQREKTEEQKLYASGQFSDMVLGLYMNAIDLSYKAEDIGRVKELCTKYRDVLMAYQANHLDKLLNYVDAGKGLLRDTDPK